jgi:hypothetical protein
MTQVWDYLGEGWIVVATSRSTWLCSSVYIVGTFCARDLGVRHGAGLL